MLKKVTKGDWELNGKNITTKAGTFVGYGKTKDDAQLMAASKKLLELIHELHQDNKDVKERVERILEEASVG